MVVFTCQSMHCTRRTGTCCVFVYSYGRRLGHHRVQWLWRMLGFIPDLAHTTCHSLCYLSLCYFPKVCCLLTALCSHFYCSNISLSIVSHIYCRNGLGAHCSCLIHCHKPSKATAHVTSHNCAQTSLTCI